MPTTGPLRARSHALKLAVVSALFAVPLIVACSTGQSLETPVSEEAPIINGHADPGHPAVVFLQMKLAHGGAVCTGTMIGVNAEAKIGYVLTAAHCLKEAVSVQVVQTSDVGESSSIISYATLDFTVHPDYTGASVSSPADVAMIRILGVDAHTPVIPILSPDNLAAGSKITSIGFGQIQSKEPF